MSIPVPVWLAFVGLLGWPLVQIASVLTVRSRRRRLRETASSLYRDDRLGPDDRGLVGRTLRQARGDPGFVVFPILLPLSILAAAIWELLGRNGPSNVNDGHSRQASNEGGDPEIKLRMRSGREVVDHDPRYKALRALAFEIGVIRWPVTAMLTLLLCIPVLPLYGLAYGARRMRTVIPDATASLWQTLQFTTDGIAPTER